MTRSLPTMEAASGEAGHSTAAAASAVGETGSGGNVPLTRGAIGVGLARP